jgi:RHS repeat-associated protein
MIQETSLNQHSSLYIYTDQNSYEPLARIDKRGNDPEKVMYFHTDLNGCPEELTDENGKILWECSFQLWGKRIHEIEHIPIQQNLRYQGQYLDRETGLHYNTFRYYDPDIGRFTQPDPIGLAGGFNLYQYAPNGLTWVDPWGWNCFKIHSRIKESNKLVKEAEITGKSHQSSIDHLTKQLSLNNKNPGIGTKPIGHGISEARARDGARVYFREINDSIIEILGKSNKANQQTVINEVLKVFGRGA